MWVVFTSIYNSFLYTHKYRRTKHSRSLTFDGFTISCNLTLYVYVTS